MPRFWNSLRISVLLLVFALAIEYALGLMLALLLNRRFRGQALFRAVFMLPMVLAPVVVGIQWRYLLSGDFGVLNYLLQQIGISNPPDWLSEPSFGVPILVTVDTWVYLPFATLILLAGLQQVPTDVIEAAALDGAGALARFRYVILSYLGPSSVLVLLLRGTAIFQTFDIVYILTGGGPGQSTEVLGLMLYHIAFSEGNMGQAAAMAIIIGLLGMALGTVLANVIRTEVRLF